VEKVLPHVDEEMGANAPEPEEECHIADALLIVTYK
jgi:hypothetical protein